MNIYFYIPGNLTAKTGGYLYNHKVADVLIKKGVPLTVVNMKGNYPEATPKDIAITEQHISSLPKGSILIFDGLAGAILAPLFKRFYGRHTFIYVEHLPGNMETGNEHLHYSEKEALESVNHIIATSEYCENFLKKSGISTDISVITPSNMVPVRKKNYQTVARNILAVGSLTKRKGHHILLESLSRLDHADWKLTICGEIGFENNYYQDFSNKVKELSVTNHVVIKGPIPEEEVHALYESSDLFVSTSLAETYGMAVMEALDARLPVVCPAISPFNENIKKEHAAWFNHDDYHGLTKILSNMTSDAGYYQKHCESIAKRTIADRGWSDVGKDFLKVLEKFQ